jgi:hypothetical protein
MSALRAILRWLGLVLLAAAYVVFIADGTRVIAGGPLAAASFHQILTAFTPAGLAAFRAEVIQFGGVGLWQPLGNGLLAAPAFAVLGIVAILLMYAGRRPRPYHRLGWR